MKVHIFVILLYHNLPTIYAKYGNNDFFTSLEAMRRLWVEEKAFVTHLESSIESLKTILPVFERYITNHKKLELDQEPNVEYLGHPINAYNLIKHSALGWKMFDEDVIPVLNQSIPSLEYVFNRANNTGIPDNEEIKGAAFGMARLHTLYSLNTDNFIKHGIVDSNFGHAHIQSKASTKKLSSFDLGILGMVAKENGLYTTSIPAMEYAMELIPRELNGDISDAQILDLFKDQTYTLDEIQKGYNFTIDYHDQLLLRIGSRNNQVQLFPHPKGNKLSDKEVKNIKKRLKKNKSKITRVDNIEDPYGMKKSDHYQLEEHNFRIDLQKELLCTGKTFRNESELKDLKCFYAHNNSPWLKLGPVKIELQNYQPYVAVIRELMFANECDEITQYLGDYLGAPPGRMSGRAGAKNDWTMKNAWPNEDNTKALEKMTLRVEHITNLLASSKKGQSDNFMCGNYGIGGHYGTHPDYYKYNTPAKDYANINRVSTVMTVLDAPDAGGATVWPFLGVNVFPEKGSAVWWFNTKSDSVPDVETKHAGM